MTSPPHSLANLIDSSGRDPLGFWRDVADTMSEALLIVSPERRIIYANKKGAALMSAGLEQSCGQLCLDVISCPQCECRCRLFEQGRVDNLEVEVYRPGESKASVFRKNARLLRDHNGEVIGGLETFADITSEVKERVEGERRAQLLLRERKRSDAIIGSMCEGVFSLDGDLRVRSFSKHMTDITGWSESDASGRSFPELFDIRSVLPDGTAGKNLVQRTLEVSVRRKNGARTPVTITLAPMRYGADELLGLLRERNVAVDEAAQIEREHSFCAMISRSAEMRRVFDVIENTADSEARVLVEGESGTGKELVSRAIHKLSSRRDRPFFAINCATFTGSLLLGELFGHERGAFTGAIKSQCGKLELAKQGTLLLDEVGEIPIQHQAVLLRVLEDRCFQRLGGHDFIELRARVVAATNTSLELAMAEGRFRRDLYYRLNVVPIRIPPLRERGDDIALLANYFMCKLARTQHAVPKQLTPGVIAAFEAYPWPGNVRELQNLVDYLGFMVDDEVTVDHLPAYIMRHPRHDEEAPPTPPPVKTRADGQRTRILAALEEADYQRSRAAKLLGIDRSTLWRRMRKYNITVD